MSPECPGRFIEIVPVTFSPTEVSSKNNLNMRFHNAWKVRMKIIAVTILVLLLLPVAEAGQFEAAPGNWLKMHPVVTLTTFEWLALAQMVGVLLLGAALFRGSRNRGATPVEVACPKASELLPAIQSIEEQASRGFSESKKIIASMSESMDVLHQETARKTAEIERLRGGYDLHIYKRLLGRFCRIHRALIEDMSDDESRKWYEPYEELTRDLLEDCGVSVYAPQPGEHIRDVELSGSPLFERVATGFPAMHGRVESTVAPGYRYTVELSGIEGEGCDLNVVRCLSLLEPRIRVFELVKEENDHE